MVHQFATSDVEIPTVVYLSTNEKDKSDGFSLNGNYWSHSPRGLQSSADLVQRRLKQRHIQM